MTNLPGYIDEIDPWCLKKSPHLHTLWLGYRCHRREWLTSSVTPGHWHLGVSDPQSVVPRCQFFPRQSRLGMDDSPLEQMTPLSPSTHTAKMNSYFNTSSYSPQLQTCFRVLSLLVVWAMFIHECSWYSSHPPILTHPTFVFGIHIQAAFHPPHSLFMIWINEVDGATWMWIPNTDVGCVSWITWTFLDKQLLPRLAHTMSDDNILKHVCNWGNKELVLK